MAQRSTDNTRDLVKRRELHVAEVRECARRIEQDRGGIIRPERLHLGLGVVVELHRLHDRIVELLDGDVLAGREMIGAAAAAVGRLHDDLRQVARIAEVAARRRHEAFLSLGEAAIEDRQRARDVALADHVGEAERHPFDARELHIVFAGGLRDGVARVDRVDRVIERDRLLDRLGAVAERGLEIDQTASPCASCSLGDVGGADGIHQRVRPPVLRVLV